MPRSFRLMSQEIGMAFKVSSGSFRISLKEARDATRWLKNHASTCEKLNLFIEKETVSGGLISYIFTPTSIGNGVAVRCACGKECDVTDYDNW